VGQVERPKPGQLVRPPELGQCVDRLHREAGGHLPIPVGHVAGHIGRPDVVIERDDPLGAEPLRSERVEAVIGPYVEHALAAQVAELETCELCLEPGAALGSGGDDAVSEIDRMPPEADFGNAVPQIPGGCRLRGSHRAIS
jgi:hypothetical protein